MHIKIKHKNLIETTPRCRYFFSWTDFDTRKNAVFIFTVSASGQINAINIFAGWTPTTWFISAGRKFLCLQAAWRKKKPFIKFSPHKKALFGWRWQNIGKVNIKKCMKKHSAIKISYQSQFIYLVNILIREFVWVFLQRPFSPSSDEL